MDLRWRHRLLRHSHARAGQTGIIIIAIFATIEHASSCATHATDAAVAIVGALLGLSEPAAVAKSPSAATEPATASQRG